MDAVAGPDRMLNPATRLLWRSNSCLQLELGDRAVVIDGPAARSVRRLAARRPAPATRPAATGPADTGPTDTGPAEAGSVPGAAMLRALADAGFLWPRPAPDGEDRLTPPVPRLAAELAALSARRGEGAAEVLSARRFTSVLVHGSGRAGPHVAALLAAAGVGRVSLRELGPVRLHHGVPGGVLPGDEGRSLAAATADAVLRAAPETATEMLPPDEPADLVVLAEDKPTDPDHRDVLHRQRRAHLVVQLAAGHGVVGPLVIPGLSSCLRCADLHRLDRDPAWTALAVQLSVSRTRRAPGEVALESVIAGLAAQQALAFLDGEQPATIDGTLEQHPPDWRIRRRSWPVHPDCDCQSGH